jgi:flagellin
MDVLGSASFVLQNEALTQNRLATDVNALASGLRVSSASDDPSGYAIAQSLKTKVAGLQQSVTNVQTGSNLLNVADGALSSIESILQRIHSLVIESNSDINSQDDLENIQTEIDSLLKEINTISSETNFNGLVLFNGQFDPTPQGGSAASITEVQSPLLTPTGSLGQNLVSNSQIDSNGDPTAPGPGPFVTPYHQTLSQNVPALLVFQVLSYSDNAIDPDSGVDVGPGVLVEFQAYSTNPAMGNAPLYTDTSAIAVNSGPIINAQYDAPSSFGGGPSNLLLQFSLANLTAADVGASAAFVTTVAQAPSAATGHSLTINDGGDEGQTVSVALPEMNTNALNVSGINVLAPTTINYMNQITGQSSSNIMAASAAELQLENAINQVSQVRAQVGAQAVALQQDAGNAGVAIVNYTASESNILDADIGATVTDYTKQQILVNVGTSVLAQMETSATQLTALLLNSFSGLGAAQGAPPVAIS